MSKSGRAAYDAQAQERGADNYLAEEGERRHDIEQRITALEEVVDSDGLINGTANRKVGRHGRYTRGQPTILYGATYQGT